MVVRPGRFLRRRRGQPATLGRLGWALHPHLRLVKALTHERCPKLIEAAFHRPRARLVRGDDAGMDHLTPDRDLNAPTTDILRQVERDAVGGNRRRWRLVEAPGPDRPIRCGRSGVRQSRRLTGQRLSSRDRWRDIDLALSRLHACRSTRAGRRRGSGGGLEMDLLDRHSRCHRHRTRWSGVEILTRGSDGEHRMFGRLA